MKMFDIKAEPIMRSILCKCLPAAALLLFAAGCVNVDYVGQTFEPIPENKPVEYFKDRGEIPPGKYRIIGRAVVTTTRRLDHYDIREILIDEARKRGADGVVLVHQKRVRRGVYDRESDVAAVDTAPASKSGNILPGGGALEVPLDSSVSLQGEHHSRIELELRVLFLKDKEDLEQELARRGRELDRLVKQPDPAKPPKSENKQSGSAKTPKAEKKQPASEH